MQKPLVKNFFISCLFSFVNTNLPAQDFFAGAAAGISNYSGDLLDKLYVPQLTKGFIGASIHYEISEQLMLRSSFTYAKVAGSDKYNSKDYLRKRNLQFESNITEFSLAAEYYLYSLYERRYSPYFFAGLAVFHFNPYTYDTSRFRFYLKPLSTEGEGIYPTRKEYSLLQPAIPFGAGIKFSINDDLRIGFEIGFRKLFTDYLDDVSTTYADYNDLLAAKSMLAVDLAYRGDELPGGNPTYPAKDTQRGSSKQKDTFYFTGINIIYRIGSVGKGGGSVRYQGKKGKFGCPSSPM